ncbi:MAG: bifunctional folylpolyglutamate synthase/dihydrofolate synthase [Nanoarchaeota archaeon]|nr:bifunctional folylpolyglutamate synthase/dihydrofolate synthase [Nanoarchaeota archaeon]
MNYKQILKELYSLENIKFTQTLVNMSLLLRKLDNPHNKLKYIHVAGTNGKGSVCAMISYILINAGYKVGMYTSPHLKKFNERIRINNKLISDKDIVKYYLRIRNCKTKCTFFEITTAMAFLYFNDKKVDFVVLETGLGGRLDSTNVITPLISIITNVAFEHTEYLGNKIEKIAYEKAGIIKKKIPVVTAAEGIALATIKKISNKENSKSIIINRNKIKIYCNKNSIRFDIDNHKNLKLKNLNGSFQIENAAIAVKAIEILNNNKKIKINKTNIINGLKNAKWPGRFQFIRKNILIDCAHNPNSFKILFNELKYIDYNKLILVVGFSNDKDIRTISKIIKPLADKIIITKSNNERAFSPITIKKYFNKNSIIIKNPKKALIYAKKVVTKNDLILITGSIFLLGEII